MRRRMGEERMGGLEEVWERSGTGVSVLQYGGVSLTRSRAIISSTPPPSGENYRPTSRKVGVLVRQGVVVGEMGEEREKQGKMRDTGSVVEVGREAMDSEKRRREERGAIEERQEVAMEMRDVQKRQ